MIEGKELKKLIEDNKEKEMIFVEYFKHKFMYRFIGVDKLTYNIWCGDTYGDIYRDVWAAIEKVGSLDVDTNVHYANISNTKAASPL